MAEPVFRGYDRAALDRQYNNSAKVGDSRPYLDAYIAASEAARARFDHEAGVSYGPHPDQTLDVFPAGGCAPAPVHVFVHGGYWMMLTRSEFSLVANALVPAGAMTVVISYALVPTVTMDELVGQCRAALAWVYRNAARHGGDPERIHVSGHSAGGHIVGMLMATDWPALDPDLPAELVRGGTGISGLYDLEPIRLCYLNDTLGLDEASAARASPVRLARRCTGPLLLPVGAREGPEYLRQSTDLAGAWSERGEPPEVLVMDGENHFSIMAQLGDPSSPLAARVLAQMNLAPAT